MNTCKNCEYSIFDEVWGEYKCKVKNRIIYIPRSEYTCKNWKEKTDGTKQSSMADQS